MSDLAACCDKWYSRVLSEYQGPRAPRKTRPSPELRNICAAQHASPAAAPDWGHWDAERRSRHDDDVKPDLIQRRRQLRVGQRIRSISAMGDSIGYQRGPA